MDYTAPAPHALMPADAITLAAPPSSLRTMRESSGTNAMSSAARMEEAHACASLGDAVSFLRKRPVSIIIEDGKTAESADGAAVSGDAPRRRRQLPCPPARLKR